MCLCLSRKLLLWNNRLRRPQVPQLLTSSVVALIRSLHEKKLLPMDYPVSSQLQKSFSKACGSVVSCLNFKCSLRHPEEETARLWSLLALRLVTCPYLRHILRPPRRRLHLVVHHILALRSREALLDNFLDNLLRSDLLPLSDCSLARRAIRSSRRSSPQPPTTGRL